MRRDGTGHSNGRHPAIVTLAAIPLVLLLLTSGVFVVADPAHHSGSASSATANRCPWVAASRAHTKSPAALAAEVVKRMTLQEKISFVVLASDPPYENVNSGIPSLCIPALTLTDGPNGIAGGATGVTQLPAAIGLAASFNPAVTNATGGVEGAEARTKGLDVVQGPDLNLARVPQSGRTFEGYGEDPVLAGVMGTANVEGIQSQGVMADAKHLTAYTQETDRVRLNQDVSQRVLEELYDAPFASAVQQGHVASVMCSYGALNGTNTCSDPTLSALLRSWGFEGFIRSDQSAVPNASAAFRAGLDLLKPASVPALTRLVSAGVLPANELNSAVTSTLRAMFAFGLVGQPRPPAIHANATSAAHNAVALWAAESSMVLLKDEGAVLPLSPATRSVAVIGSDAGPQATTTGHGSSQVRASTISTPISALRTSLGDDVKVTFTPADSPRLALPPIPARDLVGGTSLPSQTPVPTVGPGGTGAAPGTCTWPLPPPPPPPRPIRGPARAGDRGPRFSESLSTERTSSRSSRMETPGSTSTDARSSPVPEYTVAPSGPPAWRSSPGGTTGWPSSG